MTTLPPLTLASGSPRRRELLSQLGLRFTVQPVDIDESPQPGEKPEPYVLRLAREKAAAGDARGIILAADTIVTLDGDLLGKPRDEADARAMLARLSGREHQVATGVAVRDTESGRESAGVEVSTVRFASLTEREIAWYVAGGEPMDKAGAYAIQGVGNLFIAALEGNFTNVVGLPLPLVYRLLGDLGFDLLAATSSTE
jgi:septum formation protein